MAQYYGEESNFNEDAKFFKDVYIYGTLYYEFESKTKETFGDIEVNGTASFTGPANFYTDVNIENLDVRFATVRDRLNVGYGGTILTADSSDKKVVLGNGVKLGIGASNPQQLLDVAGSVKIDSEIYDSANSPGVLGAFLTKDGGGIKWTTFQPSFVEGIFVYNDGVLVGVNSFRGINLKTGRGSGINTDPIQGIVNPSNPYIADIFVYDFWDYVEGTNNIYRNSNVGINTSNPTVALSVIGSALISESINVNGATNLNSTLDVDGATSFNSTLYVVGITALNSDLDVSGSTRVGNNLDVDGITTLNSTLDVDGATRLNNTLNVLGITTLNNTLDVNGNTNLNGTLGVNGSVSFYDTLNVLGITTLNDVLNVNGATNLNSTLDVDGITTLNNTLDVDGATTLNSTLDVDGGTTLNSTLDVDGVTTLNNTLDVDGATTLNSTLDVDGVTTLNNTLDVDGATTLNSTLDVDGATTLNNTLSVVGVTSLSNNLYVVGITTLNDVLNVNGATNLNSTLDVDGITTLNNTLDVDGSTTLNNTLNVVGVTTLNSTLDVDGVTTLNNTLDVDGVTTLNNTLDVDGATTLNNTLSVVGVTTLSNTLNVDGSTRLNNTLNVLGITTLNNALNVVGVTTLNSTLDVNDATRLNNTLNVLGITTLNSTLDVNGATNLNSTLDVDGITTLNNTLDVDGATTLNNTLDVDGAATLNNTLNVVGVTTLSNTLNVDGSTRLNNTLNVVGITTLNDVLNVNGATNLNSTLDVDGITTLNNTLDVDGATTLNSTLDVDGVTTLNNTLDVDGATTLNSTLDVDGVTTLNNTLDVDGDVTFNSTTQSTDKDTGAVIIQGGVGIEKNLNVGQDTELTGTLKLDSSLIDINNSTATGKFDYRLSSVGSGVSWRPPGVQTQNAIWVTMDGNDSNSGYLEGDAKRTVGAAASIAQEGDTIFIRSGVYYENNPIGLRTDVSVSGQDLRLVTIVPNNPTKDVFYVRRGCLIENLNFSGSSVSVAHTGAGAVAFPPTTEDINAGKSFAAVSGYLAPGPATEGTSGRWRSPYIRNCTNFMSKSIGMKINGNHATASTIGADLKSMVCDSFTQYNEAGIGVSITNNGYAQLVSIFTINCDKAIYVDTGGQCDLTNSNSSFGNYGLYAVGLGSTEFTGKVNTTTDAEADVITFKNVTDGSQVRRPYDGQALYFKINLDNYTDTIGTGVITEPLQRLSGIIVVNGGSGFSPAAPPDITVYDYNTGSTNPFGPEGIIAELSPTIDEVTGAITAVDIINSGRNYLPTQDIRVRINGIATSDLLAVMEPIYYTVSEATSPTAVTGITTVTLNEFVPYLVYENDDIEMKRISRILTSGHSFEYIGTGTDINISTPLKGAVPIKENEIVALDGAQIPYTSTDQRGNFNIGEGIQINQATATITGRDFSKAIQAQVTPLILALR